jgi:hypothetical protein
MQMSGDLQDFYDLGVCLIPNALLPEHLAPLRDDVDAIVDT